MEPEANLESPKQLSAFMQTKEELMMVVMFNRRPNREYFLSTAVCDVENASI